MGVRRYLGLDVRDQGCDATNKVPALAEGYGRNIIPRDNLLLFNLDNGKPAFSMGGQYLAYTSITDPFKTVPDTLYLINSVSGQQINTHELDEPVGWVH